MLFAEVSEDCDFGKDWVELLRLKEERERLDEEVGA